MVIFDEECSQQSSTITRADLVECVFMRIGLPRNECSALVETVLAAISEAAVRGENIKISSFGTFMVRQKRERIGRNPKTGEEVPIAPRRVMTFKPSMILRDKVNGLEAKTDIGIDEA
jgi:integration host factor subunit alpha